MKKVTKSEKLVKQNYKLVRKKKKKKEKNSQTSQKKPNKMTK